MAGGGVVLIGTTLIPLLLSLIHIYCHIMLTMRPLDERGAWAAKSKKEYEMCIRDSTGGYAHD